MRLELELIHKERGDVEMKRMIAALILFAAVSNLQAFTNYEPEGSSSVILRGGFFF